MSDKITLLQSEAEQIVQGDELSDDVRQKLDVMLERGHTRDRIEEYLTDRIEDTMFDRTISVPLPSPVVISTDRSVLDECHGNPHSAGVEQ